MIWNLALAGVPGLARAAAAGSAPPGLFALYVAGYSGFRIFEETLRIDYSNHVLGLRLNFFVALVLCLLGLAWFVAIQRGWRGFGGAAPGPASRGHAARLTAAQAPAAAARAAGPSAGVSRR